MVSVIINTDGRAKALATCLESLRFLRYPNFEVVVVAGPTRDGTHELCQAYGSQIKFAECSERNLSMSRNISIQISAGEVVGFLDDDSVPEPEWLDDVVPSFRDAEVGVAGGFLHDHTGKTYQWKFGTLDRFGTADTSWQRATPEYNFPNSFHYPHVMANSLFRRSAIVDVGGFDEQYEYFLDESDIILRMVDAGWRVAQLDKGFIHHKFMPSHIRNESRVLTSWYSVIKNKTYFSLLNGGGHTRMDDVLKAVRARVEEFRTHVQWAVGEGLLSEESVARFEDEVDRALRDGLAAGMNGKRKLVSRDSLRGQQELTRFATHLPAAEQRCYVFLTRTYPPGSIGGIGRYVNHLAEAIAQQGHQVHVLTAGQGHDRVDFENGVWVHRIVIKESAPPAGLAIPGHLWNYSQTMFREAEEIANRRPVHCACAPIWDVEGIAFLVQRKFRLVTSLHTTLQSYLDSNPDKAADKLFLDGFAMPVLALEKRLMQESDGILANSEGIVEEIEHGYSFRFDRSRLRLVPHGICDWTLLAEAPVGRSREGVVRACFIGRLEARKGADVFLSIVPSLLEKYPNLEIHIVGNDQIAGAGGQTMRAIFESRNPQYVAHPRLVFHGEVDDLQLRGFYRSADIVVAPSRFESFGLVHLEAMMFGKPVIGCSAGGMKEVIQDGVTGLLALPGDDESLRRCVEMLVSDAKLRGDMGSKARAVYERHFSSVRMAQGVIRSIDSVAMAGS